MNNTVEQLLSRYRAHELSKVIDYDKFNRYAITHHSTRIEGSTLTETETQVLLDHDLTPKGKPLEHSLMVKDHFQALLFVLKQAAQKTAISVNLIQQINALVMKNTGNTCHTVLGTVDATRGEFRKGNATAGGVYFPNYDKVASLTEKLATELQATLSNSDTVAAQLQLSFAAHFNLVSIHPFYDGNGRTSRLLMNFIQARYDLPLAIVFSEDKTDYFDALQATRQQDRLEPFYQFMYHQYEKHLTHEIDQYEVMLQDRKASGNQRFNLLF